MLHCSRENSSMSELSSNDIDMVSGGVVGWPGAAIGGVYGGLGYLGSATTSGSFNFGQFGSAVGVGAVGGFYGGPLASAVGRYVVPRVSYVGGAISGMFD